MKRIIPTLLCICSLSLSAQVGVGNTNPQAQLDISASNTSTPTNLDGILIPRMSNLPAVGSMTANQDGMLVFYTGTGNSGKGFYYWDDNLGAWQFIIGAKRIDELIDGISDGSSVFLGTNAGINDNGSGNGNTGVGTQALQQNTSGASNTAVGQLSLNANTEGFVNTAIGESSLLSNSTGSGNTAIGATSLAANSTGSSNIGIGLSALQNNDTGNNNIAIGGFAARNTDASGNVVIGNLAMEQNASGNNNVVIGDNAANQSYDASGSVFIGYQAGYNETNGNRLYIENSSLDADGALIYGEFDNNILRTNAALQIGNPSSGGYTFPTVDGASNQIMTTDGNGVLSFIDPSSISGINDSDWYVLNGTNIPSSINQNIYTLGTVGIGSSTNPLNNMLYVNSGNNYGTLLTGTGLTDRYTLNVLNTQGRAARFQTGGTSLSGYSTNNVAVQGIAYGANANAGFFISYDSGNALIGQSQGSGAAIEGWAIGSGLAGYFRGGQLFANNSFRAEGGAVFNDYGADWDFRVESDTNQNMLFVNAGTSRIGIGTNTPGNPLHISIDTPFDLDHANTGQDDIFLKGGGSNALNEVGGSIGFGGTANRENLRRAAIASLQTGTDVDHTGLGFYVHGNAINLSPMVEGMRLSHQGYLGINNTNPDATLDVVGSMQFVDGNESNGYILSSDANGNASWANPSSLFTDTDTTYDGTDFALSNQSLPAGQYVTGISATGNLIAGTDQDNQTIDNFSLSGTSLRLSLEDDGQPLQTVDLSSLQDGIGTDNQTIDNFSLSGTSLRLSLEDDGQPLQTVDLSSLQDGTGTDDQTVDNFSLSGTTLRLSLEDDGQPLQTVDLSTLNNWIDGGTFLRPSDGPNEDVSIGKNGSAIGRLDVFTTKNYGIYVDNRPSGTGASYGLYSLYDNTTNTGRKTGVRNAFATTNAGEQIGTENTFYNNANVDRTGTSNRMTGTGIGDMTGVYNYISLSGGSGERYGVYNSLASDGTAVQYGVRNFVGGNSTGDKFGSYTHVLGGATANYYGARYFMNGFGTGNKYGVYSEISAAAGGSNNWAGYFLGRVYLGTNTTNGYNLPQTDGSANQIMATDGSGNVNWVTPIFEGTSASNGLTEVADDIQLGGNLSQATTISQGANNLDINLNTTGDFAIQDNGTDVFFVEDSGEIGIGTSTPAYPLHLIENNNAYTYGLYIDKAETSTSETAGIYVEKIGNGTGRNHAIFTDVTGTGNNQKYGIFNRINSSASGSQYGTRNYLNGATSANQFGTFNNMDNSATGNQYGVFNGMRGTSANNLYGVFNEFQRSFSGVNEITGVKNSFTLGTPSTDGMNGVFSEFSVASNGNYYGSRTEFTASATGTGNKYGTFNDISGSAGGIHYGTYNNVNVNTGWAGYFIGKNYISGRLSIGETNNPNAGFNVRTNSSSAYSHIELEETGGNDGSRISFTNASETNSNWLIYGRADNTDADSRLNIFYSNSGNIIEVYGDQTVEVNGQFGVNLNNPTYAIHLPNSAVTGTGQGRANAWTTYSDSRVKTNQLALKNGLSLIMQMQPKTYFHHNGNFENGRLKVLTSGEQTLGFIAQELYKVLPEAVQKPMDENQELWSVNYDKVIPVAVEAIKELNNEINILKEENQILRTKLDRIEQLEAKLLSLETRVIESSNNQNTSDTKK